VRSLLNLLLQRRLPPLFLLFLTSPTFLFFLFVYYPWPMPFAPRDSCALKNVLWPRTSSQFPFPSSPSFFFVRFFLLFFRCIGQIRMPFTPFLSWAGVGQPLSPFLPGPGWRLLECYFLVGPLRTQCHFFFFSFLA